MLIPLATRESTEEAAKQPARAFAGGLTLGAASVTVAAQAGFTDSSLAALTAAALAAAGAAAGGVALCASGLRRLTRRLAAAEAECERLRAQASLDSLTGLSDRNAFHTVLHDLAACSDTFAVLVVDLDRFTDVNATLGDLAGDEVLRELAGRFRAALPDAIEVARLGGDEFAAVLPCDLGDSPAARGYAVLEALTKPIQVGEQHIEVGASAGIAAGDPALLTGAEMLRRAHVAVSVAKPSRTEKCRAYDDALERRDATEISVRVEIGRAVISDQFCLHYQPIVDARTGLIESAEALLRSESTGLRDVSPGAVVTVAEASGQIIALTDWTIGAALAAADALGSVPVAVNISPLYFRRPEFVHSLLDKLLLARVRPEALILEVTEGVLIEDLDAARRSLARLRDVGIRVHLDDFGTGFSSLSYLQHFELDGLKLDKSFLRNKLDQRKTNQIIRSMVDFGHSLDMRVVAEGVESDTQVRMLQLLGCDLLQGYEIAMPMPLPDLLAFRDAQTTSRAPTDAWPAQAMAS